MKRRRPWMVALARLNQGENHLEFVLDIEEIGGSEHEVTENPTFEQLIGPVRVSLDISRTGRRLFVRGKVGFRARLQCASCGAEYERDFAEDLVPEYVSWEDKPVPAEQELSGEDLGRARLEGDMLDLTAPVRDAIHLAIPMAPKCRPDCRGVCPSCGKDWNEGPCGCADKGNTAGHPFVDLGEAEPPSE